MSGVSVSSMILFIAAMLVAAGVAGTLVTNVDQLSGSIDAYGNDLTDRIDTEIEIISDSGSDSIYDDGTVTILIKNTGDRTLEDDSGEFDVLVNGEYISSDDVNIELVNSDVWRSGDVAEMTIDHTLDSGEHRVVVITHGDRAEFDFFNDD